MQRHPLSAAFGDMPADEFRALVADIKAHGLIAAIVTSGDTILDGWHRYRACVEAGVKPRFEPFDYVVEPAGEQSGRTMTEAEFVVAANAHRRHLCVEQRRQIVAELLKARPEASDRAIAEMAKVDHKTVGAVRRNAEATGELPQLNKTVGKDGRARKKVVARTATKKLGQVKPAHATKLTMRWISRDPNVAAQLMRALVEPRPLVKFYSALGYALHQSGMLSNYPEAMLDILEDQFEAGLIGIADQTLLLQVLDPEQAPADRRADFERARGIVSRLGTRDGEPAGAAA